METHLFGSVIFGPVHSRRLGLSLGINLLPSDKKICTFDCVYCECGWTDSGLTTGLPEIETVVSALEKKLIEMKSEGRLPDAITYSGNGEPTIHPGFDVIIRESIRLRNLYAPNAKITVLNNSTQLHKQKVADAIALADKGLLKLDSTDEKQFALINRPASGIELKNVMNFIRHFQGEKTIQTMMLRGESNGEKIDNTTEESLLALASFVSEINAVEWMLYPIDRPTPEKHLEKMSREEMDCIGEFVRKHTAVPVTVRY
jgi:wyosine [tRNA(Phe)-imidazoG37] synthetase (radical SAM superfamily)